MAQQIPTSEVLNRAANLIEERGWGQGSFGDKGGPLCMEGGILVALGFHGFSDPELKTVEFWTCPAYVAVGDYLGLDTSLTWGVGEPEEPVWQFNDHPQRTAGEVIEVLRAAAVIEAAREQQPAGASA